MALRYDLLWLHKLIQFFLALILGGLGIAGKDVAVLLVTPNLFYFSVAGFVLLVLAYIFKVL